MTRIGLPVSLKENENRRVIVPTDICNLIDPSRIVIEKGYGLNLGISDEEYLNEGCIVTDREEVLSQKIICDPKIGDAEYLKDLLPGTTIFGWVHAVQNRDITDTIVENKITAYAWEDMFKDGRHVFWRNNELAGEAAIMHAFISHGIMPYNSKVAVLGRGNVARGAMKILTMLGAEIVQYDKNTEELFRKELGNYDVVVNAILWDVKRTDHIIYKDDLKRMKPSAMIIDISCDRNGGIETSIPTTIEDPIYVVDGIVHYVVDHTPSLFYKTFSFDLSSFIWKYFNELLSGEVSDELNNAKIIEEGRILDKRIIDFQKR